MSPVRTALAHRARLGAVLLAVALGGCGGDDAGAWIEASRVQSEAAAAAAAAHDDDAEQVALERLLALGVPDAVAAEDARVVRQDGYERLAGLLYRRGDDARALRAIEAGLALGEADDIFTANLWVIRGRVRERRGQDRAAAEDYHRALLVHERLLDAALGGEP